MNFMNNPAGAAVGGNPRAAYPMQPGMYHLANPVLAGMFDQAWQEKKKPKPKKTRAKKEKKKPSNVFESCTPPPNVDVSVLKDQGRGPIPKVKTSTPPAAQTSSSFLDNPTAFLAEQTALISSSLTSTLSSPPQSSSGGASADGKSTDHAESETVDGESSKRSSISESVETTSSPNVVVHNTSSSGIGTAGTSVSSSNSVSSLAAAVGAVMSNVAKTAMESSSSSIPGALSSNESHLSSNLSDTNIFTEDHCESLSPEDSNEECPALTETMTPSSVVHHTPDSSKEEFSEESSTDTSASVKVQSLANGAVPNITTEILSKFGPSLVTASIQEKASLHVGGPALLSQTLISAGPDKPEFGSRPKGSYNTLQQMLGHQTANQFPASKLLSAAARAQMAQQNLGQNGTELFIGPQSVPNLHLVQPLGVKSSTNPVVSSQCIAVNNRKESQVCNGGINNILKTMASSVAASSVGINASESCRTSSAPAQSFNALKAALAASTKSLETRSISGLPSVPGVLSASAVAELAKAATSSLGVLKSMAKSQAVGPAITTSSIMSTSANNNVASVQCSKENSSSKESSTLTTASSESSSSGCIAQTQPSCSSVMSTSVVSSGPVVAVIPPAAAVVTSTSQNLIATTVVSSVASHPLLSTTACTTARVVVSSAQQNPVLSIASQSQAPNSGIFPMPAQPLVSPINVAQQTPAISIPMMSPMATPQSSVMSSLGSLQQNLNPQSVLNLFQNIGLQQLQQGQNLNQIQTTANVGNFPGGNLMMPSGVQNNMDSMQCLQLPQNNFSLNSSSFPQLLGQCGPNFSSNNQMTAFNMDNSFQTNLQKAGQLMQVVQPESQTNCVQIKSAMTNQSCDISQPMNKVFTEQVATSQQGQVLLVPNMQMPMMQVFGGNQPLATGVPADKPGFSNQFTQNTDLQVGKSN